MMELEVKNPNHNEWDNSTKLAAGVVAVANYKDGKGYRSGWEVMEGFKSHIKECWASEEAVKRGKSGVWYNRRSGRRWMGIYILINHIVVEAQKLAAKNNNRIAPHVLMVHKADSCVQLCRCSLALNMGEYSPKKCILYYKITAPVETIYEVNLADVKYCHNLKSQSQIVARI